MDAKQHHPKRTHFLKQLYQQPGILLLTVVIVLIGAFAAIAYVQTKGERINHDGYQVVYMTSGQVYFGRLVNTAGNYLVLKDPYTAQDVTAKDAAEASAETSTTLLKVSRQQYGPEDVMSLRSDQVLFWQNLRSDSRVSQAIENAKQ